MSALDPLDDRILYGIEGAIEVIQHMRNCSMIDVETLMSQRLPGDVLLALERAKMVARIDCWPSARSIEIG
ncbi:hypothetical protein D3C87_2145530 [compost metagenome]